MVMSLEKAVELAKEYKTAKQAYDAAPRAVGGASVGRAAGSAEVESDSKAPELRDDIEDKLAGADLRRKRALNESTAGLFQDFKEAHRKQKLNEDIEHEIADIKLKITMISTLACGEEGYLDKTGDTTTLRIPPTNWTESGVEYIPNTRQRRTMHHNFQLEMSFLMLACHLNNLEIVKLLIENGANPNQYELVSPLVLACQNGNLEMVEYLLEKGANPIFPREEASLDAINRIGNTENCNEIANRIWLHIKQQLLAESLPKAADWRGFYNRVSRYEGRPAKFSDDELDNIWEKIKTSIGDNEVEIKNVLNELQAGSFSLLENRIYKDPDFSLKLFNFMRANDMRVDKGIFQSNAKVFKRILEHDLVMAEAKNYLLVAINNPTYKHVDIFLQNPSIREYFKDYINQNQSVAIDLLDNTGQEQVIDFIVDNLNSDASIDTSRYIASLENFVLNRDSRKVVAFLIDRIPEESIRSDQVKELINATKLIHANFETIRLLVSKYFPVMKDAEKSEFLRGLSEKVEKRRPAEERVGPSRELAKLRDTLERMCKELPASAPASLAAGSAEGGFGVAQASHPAPASVASGGGFAASYAASRPGPVVGRDMGNAVYVSISESKGEAVAALRPNDAQDLRIQNVPPQTWGQWVRDVFGCGRGR